MCDLESVAKAFTGFRPASEVLTYVRAVPTIFPQYDHGTRVGGHPADRIALLHGPSGQGKSYFSLGLCASFLDLDFPALYVDAERTLELGFVRTVMGARAEHPLFFLPDQLSTYEEVRKLVRAWCNRVREMRAKGKLPADACGLIIVDSIRKLVPSDMWDRLNEAAKSRDAEKARDRSAQIKAAMNAVWCDELIPLLEQTGCTMVIIARETDDPDADPRMKKYGHGYKIGGGSALYYDASLVVRVDRQRYVTKESKEGLRPTVFGERHRVTIKKSKVAGKEDKTTICFFHSSNGKLVPQGPDRARDVLELARSFGLVKGAGSLAWGAIKWRGEHAAVKALTAAPEQLARLEAEVRARFKAVRPLEVTEDGEVVEE
jgi:RecA/RadA recombinase